jgi:putative acyl-CoA dehydrogenase
MDRAVAPARSILAGMSATHEVLNQPPPRVGHDTFAEDVALREAVEREGAAWAAEEIHTLGRMAGDPVWLERGRQANEHRPELLTHDRYGHRIDEVRYHPSYHELMAASVAHGLHAAPWAEDRPGAHVARAAKFMAWTRVDAGHSCPISMTYAVIPSLRHQPDLAAEWEPRALSATYDPTFRPASEKAGAIFGMAMTEKQGGSDVRANTSSAVPIEGGGPGTAYRLTGHKWFCSAPMSDAFLVLAKIGGPEVEAPSCFLVPRWLPDGTRNVFRLQRLKDKLGDRSNASSEVEFDGTVGWLVGEEHRGVRTIIEMVGHTRLDCAVGAAAGMRHGLAEAAWHTAHRSAFGKRLADQPLMRAVLADLAVESEAATALALRLARAFDEAAADPSDQAAAGLKRLGMPVAKYWLCKRAPAHAAEALECLGGAGYVEESGMPRLFRQSPLNGIWEGSGNVQCLDVLRAMARSPESVEALIAEISTAAGADRRLDEAMVAVQKDLTELSEATARTAVERMALVLQGALLVRDGDPAVADAFVATRLAGGGGLAFGTIPATLDVDRILARALPALA